MKYFKSFCLLIIILFLSGCSLENFWLNEQAENIVINDNLKIHYLDVGQGDAIFIELPNEETMLIDAGEAKYQEQVLSYIENLNYEKIDYVVGTHPHTDHIGGLAYIIKNKDIGQIYLPKVSHNSKTYENLLLTIKNKGKQVTGATQDMKIINGADLKVLVLAPTSNKFANLNNASIVLKIIFKDKSFLFMGDAEESVEKTLTDVDADVIKVGHHGSDTSSSLAFLKKVSPEYAIISVGENNQYNHPSLEVIKRYESLKTKVYRTDLNRTIDLVSDGKTIDIKVEKGE